MDNEKNTELIMLKIAALEWEARYHNERLLNIALQHKALLEEHQKLTDQQNGAE